MAAHLLRKNKKKTKISSPAQAWPFVNRGPIPASASVSQIHIRSVTNTASGSSSSIFAEKKKSGSGPPASGSSSSSSHSSSTSKMSHSSSDPNLVSSGQALDFPPVSAVTQAVQKVPAAAGGSQAVLKVEDIQTANKSLVERIRLALNFDEDKYSLFKTISGEYRQGLVDTEAYLAYAQQFGLLHLVSELARLCPDPNKQRELIDTYAINFTRLGHEDNVGNGLNISSNNNNSTKGKGKGKEKHAAVSEGGGGSGISRGGIQSIPAVSRKMVQSLKEIVNCSEVEIYSVLKECNMDPNETVNKLLSQDPFHEVKSKREKRKETKELTEPKPRGSVSRGSKVGSAHHVGHSGGSSEFSPYERIVSGQGDCHGKSAYKKENGVNPYLGAASGMTNSTSRLPPCSSNSISPESKLTVDSYSTSSQLHGYQPAWSGAPGHVSMADIVKMGRPLGKVMNTVNSSQHINHHHVQAPRSELSHCDVNLSEYPVTKASELDHEKRVISTPDDDWPIDDHILAATESPVTEPINASGLHEDASLFSTNRNGQLPQSQEDEARLADVSIERVDEASHFNNALCSDTDSYQLHSHNFENQKDDEADVHVSSMTTNMQNLRVEEDQELQLEEENPIVIIPDHLQVQAEECLHLSFGTFGSGISAALSGPFTSRDVNLKHNLEGASVDAVGVSSAGHSEARNLDYYESEPIRTTDDENLGHISSANAENFEQPSVSEPMDLKEAVLPRENQYVYPPSTTNYAFGNDQQLNASLAQEQSISQMQNLPPFSSAMQLTYSNSQANSLLASNAEATRESDLSYSPFPQSMTSRYGNALTSIGGSTIPISDGDLPGNNLGTGPTLLQQHLAMHPYSQPTHPLGPFSNMISSYPFLPPQSYTYMPSAFQQQALANNGPYHHSLTAAALLPQYKSNVSSLSSSLPQSSGYGGFGNSTNFHMNPPPTAPGPTTMSYDDVMSSSQYNNDINRLISLQQNENSPLWVHGPGARTIPGVPPSTYYSLTGQSQQQASGFRQTQQPPAQNYGAQGYPNPYHLQMDMAMAMAMEHQPPPHQSPRDSLVGSQGQSSRQSQQMWQNS